MKSISCLTATHKMIAAYTRGNVVQNV